MTFLVLKDAVVIEAEETGERGEEAVVEEDTANVV